jgi:hypothetical protein
VIKHQAATTSTAHDGVVVACRCSPVLSVAAQFADDLLGHGRVVSSSSTAPVATTSCCAVTTAARCVANASV